MCKNWHVLKITLHQGNPSRVEQAATMDDKDGRRKGAKPKGNGAGNRKGQGKGRGRGRGRGQHSKASPKKGKGKANNAPVAVATEEDEDEGTVSQPRIQKPLQPPHPKARRALAKPHPSHPRLRRLLPKRQLVERLLQQRKQSARGMVMMTSLSLAVPSLVDPMPWTSGVP